MGYRTRLTPFADEALGILDSDDRKYLVFVDNFHLFEEPRLLLAELQARPELRRRVMVIGVTAMVLPIRAVSSPFDVIDDFLSMLALAYLAVVRSRLPGAGFKGGRSWRSWPPTTS